MTITVFYICDKGDTVDVVVPPLAESINDGTLANFLKSMFILEYVFILSILNGVFYELLVSDRRVCIL